MQRTAPVRRILLAAALFLAACTPPDYAGPAPFTEDTNAPPPEIAALDPIRAQRDAAPRAAPAQAELQARGAELRARAEALRTAEP